MHRGFFSLGKTYRHLARYSEIASVLVKFGLGDALGALRPERFFRFAWRRYGPRPPQVRGMSRGERVLGALTELGPAFIKLGQFMSNRPDVLPEEIIISLRKLQDEVAPFASEEAVAIIEREFRRPVSVLFKEFSFTPAASASIAQVHHALLHGGEEVAVKIRRPRIEQTIDTDIEIMYEFASLIERHVPEARFFDLQGLCKEFDRSIHKELDFQNEAAYMERFADNFRGDATIYVPKVFGELSTKKVLTTEYMRGIKVSERDKILEAGLDPSLIAQRGAILLLRQMFEFGFFHGDPHPGNLLALEGNVICFLDFGIMGIVSPRLQEYFAAIMIGITTRNPQKIVRTLLEVSRLSSPDINAIEYDVTEILEEYAYLPLKDLNMDELLKRLTRLIITHRLQIIPGAYMLFKAMITMEGVGLSLDPCFHIVKHIEPFASKMLREQLNPLRMLRSLYASSRDLGYVLRDIPYDVKELLAQMKAGRMRIDFHLSGMEPMLLKHDQLVTRIVFAVILAALIIGSSLVVLSGIPPKFHGVPLIGVIGFLAAGIIGFWLLLSIIFRRRMY